MLHVLKLDGLGPRFRGFEDVGVYGLGFGFSGLQEISGFRAARLGFLFRS